MIVLREISKIYDSGDVQVHALRKITLTIERGEFVAIMGASGSGKSTLMNVLGLLDTPSGGEYWLEEQQVSQLSQNQLAKIRNRHIGFVFQSFNLLSRTSALDNVELPLIYAEIPKLERQQRAIKAIAQVGLANRQNHLPNQLSGGQQQRIAIARAIVSEPQLILADEPTGNLDSKTSIEIMQLFQHLVAQGMTVVLVTHEADIAGYASRVITMRDGNVLSDIHQREHR